MPLMDGAGLRPASRAEANPHLPPPLTGDQRTAAAFATLKAKAVKLLGNPLDSKGTDRKQHAALQQLANVAFLTTRQLFYRPDDRGMTWLKGQQHNEWTMCLFVTYLHSVVSALTHAHFTITIIKTYAGKLLTAMNIALGFPIISVRTASRNW